MADYGLSFSPDLANRFRASLNNPTGAGQLSPQVGQALQVLSLHIPDFVGGSPILPDSLLRPRLGGFTPDAAVRAQTAGSSAAPLMPAPGRAEPTPAPDSSLSVFAPSIPSASRDSGSASPFSKPTDTGPSSGITTAPPPPNWVYGADPANRQPPGSTGPAPGGGAQTPAPVGESSPLSDLVDAFLRGGDSGRGRL